MIRLERVTKQFPGGQFAVQELSIDFPTGELTMLVGPSGCGKTTTLKMINRLVEPTSGRIFIGDDDVTRMDPVRLRRRIGYVIQQVGLFPHLDVGSNVATVPRLLGWDKRRIRARVDEAVKLGDCIAILKQGGVLAQCAAPAEVLGNPASEFVADFVGADRGLKRLNVTSIERADVEKPPVVSLDEPLRDARRSMDAD